MSDHIEISRDGAVQIIRMNRPDKKNAITRAMYARMAQALTSADEDDEIRVNVLFGVPGSFSAGNDIADFVSVAMGAEGGEEVFTFLRALASTRRPLISGVDGLAVGIGTTIQLHCDLSFATERSQFHTPFVDLGIVPEAGSTLLGPALLGRQKAFSLLALGEKMSALEAKEAGLIFAILGESELETHVLDVAQKLASKPKNALRLSRDLLLGDHSELLTRIDLEGQHFRDMLRTDEAKAALMAFATRKKK